jgi:regulatory protein YycH of two-component signal transduction system YycFG
MQILSIIHHLHSSDKKGIIERTILYINDRTEWFDDYFLCTKARCKLQHIINWLSLFVNMHNKEIEKKIVVK